MQWVTFTRLTVSGSFMAGLFSKKHRAMASQSEFWRNQKGK
ncbi:hypothetical protein SC09_Contig24orf00081 [Bacillus subtilis]|uniref:Uncharacterized protein n=1 Tax=Bacillus subtilis TaxID=1423 RepID=A0A0D1IPE0_BACIU|nr:hypothetical protein SC09_Contig24orf00081 [Bacillus subtilis]